MGTNGNGGSFVTPLNLSLTSAHNRKLPARFQEGEETTCTTRPSTFKANTMTSDTHIHNRN